MILKPRPLRKPRKDKHWSKNGLVGLWLINEGGGRIIADLSGNGNTGTFAAAGNSPAWIGGNFGPAIRLDGDDYLSLNKFDSINFTTNDFTVLAGINQEASHSNDFVISHRGGAAGYEVYIDDGVLACLVRDSGGLTFGTSGGIDFDSVTGSHQIAVVFNRASTADFYVDGQPDGSGLDISPRPGSYAHSGDYFFGAQSLSPNEFFQGVIDYVLIYSRSLSSFEITQLHKNPFIMFDREPIELWVGANEVAAPTGIVVLRRRREGY